MHDWKVVEARQPTANRPALVAHLAHALIEQHEKRPPKKSIHIVSGANAASAPEGLPRDMPLVAVLARIALAAAIRDEALGPKAADDPAVSNDGPLARRPRRGKTDGSRTA